MRDAADSHEAPTETQAAEAAVRQIVQGEATRAEAIDAAVLIAAAGVLGFAAFDHPFLAGLGAGVLCALVRGRQLK